MNNSAADGVPNNIAGRTYFRARKMNDLRNPGPANCFTFIDETAFTLLDFGGITFSVDAGLAGANMYWRNMPARYHGSSGNMGFADGHSELHKWVDKNTIAPVQFNVTSLTVYGSPAHVGCKNSVDFQFVEDHMPYH
jgi:prepilin-type processing-associated H-X9-DG protein